MVIVKYAMVVMVVGATILADRARGAYLISIDTDGSASGTAITYNAGFAFGGDTTSASVSSTPSSAFGMPSANSIFGGNGATFPDTYVFTYNPASQVDNLAIPSGTDLGGGNLATGISGGGPGVYAVYATWPVSGNVSGGNPSFTVSTAGDTFQTAAFSQIDTGNEWFLLGTIDYTSGPITVTQEAGSNTFVSMRSSGVLFEAVPEPSASFLLGVTLFGLVLSRRR